MNTFLELLDRAEKSARECLTHESKMVRRIADVVLANVATARREWNAENYDSTSKHNLAYAAYFSAGYSMLLALKDTLVLEAKDKRRAVALQDYRDSRKHARDSSKASVVEAFGKLSPSERKFSQTEQIRIVAERTGISARRVRRYRTGH